MKAILINKDLTQIELQYYGTGVNYNNLDFNLGLDKITPIICNQDNLLKKLGINITILNVCPCDTQLTTEQLNHGVIKYPAYPTYGIFQYHTEDFDKLFANSNLFNLKSLNGIIYLEGLFFQSYSGDDNSFYKLNDPFVVQIFKFPELKFDLGKFINAANVTTPLL